jgi:hypothetical protein
MNLLIGSVAGTHRVQWTFALVAVEALLVPHCSLGKLLFGSKDCTTASWASLTFGSFDGRGVSDDEWTVLGDVILAKWLEEDRKLTLNAKRAGKICTQSHTNDRYLCPSVCKKPDPQANP